MSGKRGKSGRGLADPDDPPAVTAEWIAEADVFRGRRLVRRGRPKLANPRQLLSLRIPPEVVARWKATGPGWQTRMVELLARAMPRRASRSPKARAT